MRLIKISAPAGKGSEVAKVAFACGIQEVSIHQAEQHQSRIKPKAKDVIDIQLATPDSKAFVEALVRAPFFDRDEFSLSVREPRAILKSGPVRDVTRPVAASLVDIDQELWQFTHVTPSFVARVLIAAFLLAYGMIHDNPLFMIGGLIFLPLMPLMLAFSFGALTQQWSLVLQSTLAFVTATLLIVAGGAAVASAADPPMMFDMFPPLAAGALFSLVIAIAAALATADDAGHRQLIGLAAASQIALIPAWFGISFVFGFSESPAEKLNAFGLNLAGLLIGGAIVYGMLGRGKSARTIVGS